MSLRIRRGTEDQRTGVVFDSGELVVTTNEFKLFVGDGATLGGRNIAENLAGVGLVYNPNTEKLDTTGPNITTDEVPEGILNQYFTNERAQDAVWTALQAGQSLGNVVFSYDDLGNKLYANVTLDGIGLTAIVQDTTPSLGGDLDLNSNDITGTGNITVTGDVTVTGSISATVDIDGEHTGNFTGTATLENPVCFGTPFPPLVNNPEVALTAWGMTDGESGGFVDLVGYRGSFASKENLLAGDFIGGFRVSAYTDDTKKSTVAFAGILDASANLTDPNPATDAIIAVSNNLQEFVFFEFGNNGIFAAPAAIKTGSYASTTELTTNVTAPAPGMIVYVSADSKFYGYVDNAGAGSPGWVPLN